MGKNESPIKMGGVLIDSDDAGKLADFYTKLIGWEKTNDADGWSAIQSPDGVHTIGFQTVEGYKPPVWPWEDGKQAQMMHLDFSAVNVDEAVAFALECGARVADVQFFDMARVMLDPAGHPFCICPEG